MSDSRQFPPFCNFMMLTTKLHGLFLHYIRDGRRRAPPISDLVDLISSFQLGARTDRRALQSKFKSWARRMTVEDGRLKLANSKKEIVPLEKCDDLVMCLHSDGHKSIDQVILKIREKYTWTKKNFGMDRFMVMNYILRNCSNLECKRQIEIEISRRDCCDNFIKNVIISSESQAGMFQNFKKEGIPVLNNSIFNSSTLYPWPLVFPLSSNSIPYEPSLPLNLAKTEVKPVIPLTSSENKPCFPPLMPKNFQNGFCLQSPKPEAKNLNQIQKPPGFRENKFNKPSFRKPKNISEFKTLLCAAEQLTEAYPSILRDPKTTFLGGLDLAPKKICSKRTLMKFQKEKRRKIVLEKQHYLYHKNRKNLRDRNKLNKIKLKQEQEKRAYLEASGSQKKGSSSDVSLGDSNDNKTCSERTIESSEIEIVKVIPSKHEPEVILITSSDDENSDNIARPTKSEGIEVVKGDGEGQFSISNKVERSEKDIEVVFNTESSSQNDMNAIRFTNQYTQHPVLKKVLLPPNIRGEIAVLPFSRYSYLKPLGHQVSSSGNQDFNKKSSIKGKNSILQPFSHTNIGNKSAFLNKITTGQYLPESKYLLFKKTESSNALKIITQEEIRAPIPQPSCQLNKDFSNPVEVVIDESTNVPTAVQKEKVISVQKTIAKPSQNSNPKKRSIHDEMSKLSKWIRKTKKTMVTTLFNQQVERSSRNLVSQLNAGITLIRSIRRKLLTNEID